MDNAIAWAKAHGLSRTNEVHGAEEYRVPTMEYFSNKNVDKTSTKATATAQVEDSWWFC